MEERPESRTVTGSAKLTTVCTDPVTALNSTFRSLNWLVVVLYKLW